VRFGVGGRSVRDVRQIGSEDAMRELAFLRQLEHPLKQDKP